MKATLPSSTGHGGFSLDFGDGEKVWEAATYRCNVSFGLPLWHTSTPGIAHISLPALKIDGGALKCLCSALIAWLDLPLQRLAATPLTGRFALVDETFGKLILKFNATEITNSLGAQRAGFVLSNLPFDAEFRFPVDQSCLRIFHEELQLAMGCIH